MGKKLNFVLLFSGMMLVFLTHASYGIGILAWISPIPFLVYLEKTNGVKSKFLLFFAMFLGWSLSFTKIVTEPIPIFLGILFAIPVVMLRFSAYLIWDKLKKDRYSFFLFPAVMVIAEWIQAELTPFASWGTVANTQIENLPLLQFLSIFGIYGLAFLIYLFNILLKDLILKRVNLKKFSYIIIIIVFIQSFGYLRLTLNEIQSNEMELFAAIGSDSKVGVKQFPDREERLKIQNILFKRTKKAALSGAKLIVWTEAATGVLPEEENEFKSRLKKIIKDLNVDCIASYIVIKSFEPIFYENKFIFIDRGGEIIYTYYKHEPVPGEPCKKGLADLKAKQRDYGKISGAICYDYDFPYFSRQHSELGVDIVGLPSSDWRGIDPVHTQMAALRSIEGGYSILRSTRFGLSAGIDHHGRILGRLSHFDSKEKILLVSLPKKGIKTIYSKVGNIIVWLSMIILIYFIYKKLRFKLNKDQTGVL